MQKKNSANTTTQNKRKIQSTWESYSQNRWMIAIPETITATPTPLIAIALAITKRLHSCRLIGQHLSVSDWLIQCIWGYDWPKGLSVTYNVPWGEYCSWIKVGIPDGWFPCVHGFFFHLWKLPISIFNEDYSIVESAGSAVENYVTSKTWNRHVLIYGRPPANKCLRMRANRPTNFLQTNNGISQTSDQSQEFLNVFQPYLRSYVWNFRSGRNMSLGIHYCRAAMTSS